MPLVVLSSGDLQYACQPSLSGFGDDPREEAGAGVHDEYDDGPQESIESLQIVLANALPHPRAVMIQLKHAASERFGRQQV